MYEKIYSYFNIFFFTNVKASIILDYETEIFIKDILNIIKEVNNYNRNINFSIILDENPNAFIDKNNNLFISTGLIKYTESYEALIGVLAHEVGHLDKFHISKRKQSIKKIKNLEKLSTLSIIAGSLIAQNNKFVAESLIASQTNLINYGQSFSKDQEREADYYGINTLNKLNLSKEPLINFLKYLEKEYIKKNFQDRHIKFSSHPIFKERLNIIQSEKKDDNIFFDKKINIRFMRIKAKLFGFTENNFENISVFLDGDYLIYANSIIISKEGNLKKSMSLINLLINKNVFENYILETKADILYSHGYLKEALLFYKKIIDSYPNNYYAIKRQFEIQFSLISRNNNDHNFIKSLFRENKILINIFKHDRNLKYKLHKLSIMNKNND